MTPKHPWVVIGVQCSGKLRVTFGEISQNYLVIIIRHSKHSTYALSKQSLPPIPWVFFDLLTRRHAPHLRATH